MIYGIGHDICSISRIKKSCMRESFLNGVFGEQELSFLKSLGEARKYQSIAANFAVKEAFLKSCGKGIGDFPLREIQTVRLNSGAPMLLLTGRTGEWAENEKLNAFVSITHEGDIASAVVVLEKQ